MQLSIIIVNYNVKYFLEQCLYSVLKACQNIEAEIFVVDNNSTDGSKAFFADKFSTVKFFWNSDNVGFAKANNQVILQCSGEYVLFLNPDTILPEDCLEQSIAFIQSQQNPGALGIRLIDGSGNFLKESKRGFPSPATSLFKLAGLASLFPHSKLFAHYYLGNLDEHKSYEVDVLVGAFMLMSKNVLAIVGGFDESFFMYGEDIDLSYRIQKEGLKNCYCSGTTAIHFKGESTKKDDAKYIKIFYNAMAIFAKKHYSSGSAGIFNMLIQAGIWLRAILSAIISAFKKLFSIFIPVKKKQETETILIGEENDCNAFIELIKKAGVRKIIIGKISNTNNSRSSYVHSLNDLPSLIKQYPSIEIIFCEGGLSFKEIIDTMQQLPGVRFKFYAKGSNSIIGSNSKDTGGDFIALG